MQRVTAGTALSELPPDNIKAIIIGLFDKRQYCAIATQCILVNFLSNLFLTMYAL